MNQNTMGNLGEIRQLQNKLALKRVKLSSVELNDEELNKIDEMLSDFDTVLRNLSLNKNALRDYQFGGLLSVLEDMKKKNY
ncbi:hypothetical protein [Bacillus atrophaeus]|uniref:hypothetical protein n=1 Tax=Bacillus atrophaeus TaxID=1452 RepID=UPI000779B7AF|nr:hypothetical protein [Bacillus atrophaeus]KYD05310.1 hypothetical protein B4144_1917 [Bacillus atrophaeus]WIT27849.1 hypothetical protein [Bacillus phage SPbetaL6]WIT28035.1 hypothetical protein [Bacillus phage SPbetaL7]